VDAKTENEIYTTLEIKSGFDHPRGYYGDRHDGYDWRFIAEFKDQTIILYDKRWQAAKLVIDAIARRIGLNLIVRESYLYAPDGANGESAILRKLEEYLDRSGDKVQLKRRINELERENAVLRSLVRNSARKGEL
jgi:hypothetical protein